MTTPIPDPTVLTTAALHREIEHMKELLTQRIDGVEDRIDRHEALRIEMKIDATKQVDDAKQDTAKAVDTALSAANIATAAVAETTNILRDRVVALESVKIGNLEQRAEGRDQRTEGRSSNTLVIGIMGLVFTAVIVVLGILAFVGK
jgi:hypothetical protein